MSFSEGGYHGEGMFGKIRKEIGKKTLPILTTLSLGLGAQACEQDCPSTDQVVGDTMMTANRMPEQNTSPDIKKINPYDEILKTAREELYRVRMGGVENGEIKYFKRIYRDKNYRLKVKRLIEKYSEESGVPLDTAYSVAALESGFDNKASISVASKDDSSQEVTAAGVYQMRVPAARKMGLVVDEEKNIDERYVLEKNIKGGLGFLAEYNEDFENWPLALTAYSHGKAGLCRKLHSLFPELTLNKRLDDFDVDGKDMYLKLLAKGDLKIEHLYVLDRIFFKYAFDTVAITDLAYKYIDDSDTHPIKIKHKEKSKHK